MQIEERQALPAHAGRALAEQISTVTLLMRAEELLGQAMSQHIYDAANGEKPGPECAYTVLLSDLKNFLAHPRPVPGDVLAEGLRLIASQSIGPDWTHQQAFDFIRTTAKAHLATAAGLPPAKIVMVLSGGLLQSVHGSDPFPHMDVVLVDRDHLEERGRSDDESDEIEAAAIAECPNALLWVVADPAEEVASPSFGGCHVE